MIHSPVYFEDFSVKLNETLNELNPNLIVILTDENIHNKCLATLLPKIKKFKAKIELFEIPVGEQSKNLKIATEIWELFSELNADRNSLILNFGGGAITDFGGFVASVYKRGIPFINIPTSLLAMVDAAIGGKTAVDMNGIKNLLGVFNFPIATFIQPEFLETLPEREFRSGLAEMLKHGLIYDKKHWQKLTGLSEFNVGSISALIKESANIKLSIVEKDPYEKGLRKILNFGHTIGHAIESEFLSSENPLLHGEAVVIGMLVESVLSAENELINQSELDEIFLNLTHLFGKTKIEEKRIENLFNWMQHDKKNIGNKLNFSLLDGIGNARFNVKQSKNQITAAIKIYNQLLEG